MATSRQRKQEVRSEIEQALGAAKSVVFTGFSGVTVADATAMRRTLTQDGVSYQVVKKSLVGKALDGLKVSGDRPKLEGQIAVAYGADLVAPARGIFAAGKKLDGKVKILGGIFDGVFKDAAGMTEIASIPPIPTLRGMFVNIINSPIQRMVIALAEIAKKKAA